MPCSAPKVGIRDTRYNWRVPSRRLFIFAVLLACTAYGQDHSTRDSCASAARRLLGANAEVVKYGSLGGAGVDCVAVVTIRPVKNNRLLVADLAIFRSAGSGWKVIL